jgi:hypothetical protein
MAHPSDPRATPLRALPLLLVLVTTACATVSPPPSASPPAVDRELATRQVSGELDDLHDAAAHADESRYFAHFAPSGVFLGTDATERWDLGAFRAYAHPRFSAGKGWVYRVKRRAVTVSDDGDTAWFDEDLLGEKAGPTRGSGVLVRRDGRWLLAQYNLAFTVPNDRFEELRRLLASPPSVDLATRYKAVYEQATAAATGGDFARATTLLEALVPEAKTRPDDDLEFWLHNELTWLRWAQADLHGALAEVDQAKATLDHALLADHRRRALRLHELWDRSYLALELSQANAATRKTVALGPKANRAEYDALAKQADDRDGMAVLEAFFALGAGDGKAAAAAAKRVDVAKDEDVQDLYVIASALDAAGDKEAAASVRGRICSARAYLMKPLIVHRLAQEGHGCV